MKKSLFCLALLLSTPLTMPLAACSTTDSDSGGAGQAGAGNAGAAGQSGAGTTGAAGQAGNAGAAGQSGNGNAGAAGQAGNADAGGQAGNAGAAGQAAGAAGTNSPGSPIFEFIGTPIDQELDWATGQPLTVSVKGAEVRIGNPANTSITVGSNAQVPQGEIRVRFTPINSETKENQNKAATEMNSPANGGNLVLDAGSTGGAVTISVAQQGTHSNGLSALVDVLVPPGFDGAVTTQTETGDVSIQGVKNSVTLSTDLGNVAVTMAGIPVAGSNGDILTKNGDITFSVPSASNLSIQALVDASNFISYDNAAGWQEIAGSTAQSATLCGGTACSGTSTGNWKIESKFGSITVKLP